MNRWSTRSETCHIALICVVFLCIAIIAASAVVAQEVAPRRIWDDSFKQKRPKPKAPAPAAATNNRKQPSYRRVPPPVHAAVVPKVSNGSATSNYEVLGLTIWRMRPSQGADEKEVRELMHENDASGILRENEMTPERVASNDPLPNGTHVRISIETPRNGYLYVIDRERYANGKLGDPLLIFPTLRTHGGDNRITAGRVIEIPAQEDQPSYLRLKLKPGQISEVLTILVTSEPIENLRIERRPIKLPKESVEQWEKSWKTQMEQFEMDDSAGQPYSKAEKMAGADRKRELTQDDPLPQTLYRVATKPGAPLLVTVPLQINR